MGKMFPDKPFDYIRLDLFVRKWEAQDQWTSETAEAFMLDLFVLVDKHQAGLGGSFGPEMEDES